MESGSKSKIGGDCCEYEHMWVGVCARIICRAEARSLLLSLALAECIIMIWKRTWVFCFYEQGSQYRDEWVLPGVAGLGEGGSLLGKTLPGALFVSVVGRSVG